MSRIVVGLVVTISAVVISSVVGNKANKSMKSMFTSESGVKPKTF